MSANTSFLVVVGPEAERCESDAGMLGIVDSAGADKLGSENSDPWCGEERPASESEGEESDDKVNKGAGRLGMSPPELPALALLECEDECDGCRCSPSI